MNNHRLKQIDKIIGSLLVNLLQLRNSFIRDNKVKKNDAIAVKNILVIKTVGIGDLVLLLPAIKLLKDNIPHSKITLLTTPRTEEVVEGQPFIDDIIYWNPKGIYKGFNSLFDIFKQIKQSKFDAIIDAEHYYNFSSIISFLNKSPVRIGFNINGQKRSKLLTHPVEYKINTHEINNFLSLLKPFDINHSSKIELIPPITSNKDKEYAEKIILQLPTSSLRIIIHPGTSVSASSRQWPIGKFADLSRRLISELHASVFITGASDEQNLAEKIISQNKDLSKSIFNLTGKTTLKQFAEIVKICDLFVSADTGPMHVAVSTGVPTLGLFGPNTPIKWGPFGDNGYFIYNPTDCSPCIKQYLGQITQCEDNRCMQNISVEDVFSKIKEGLSFYKHV